VAAVYVVLSSLSPRAHADTVRIVAGTATNSQIWVSDDGGDTWTFKKDFSKEVATYAIMGQVYDPYHDRLVAGLHGIDTYWTIWVSPDRGETWKLKKKSDHMAGIKNEHDVRALTYDSHNHRVIAGTIGFNLSGALNGEIWTSDDGGDTWTMKKDLSTVQVPQGVKSLTYDSFHKRVVAGTANSAQIWASDDGGDTWTLKKDISLENPAQQFLSALLFVPFNKRIIAGTAYNAQIWASDDGGDTWALKKDLAAVSLADRIYGSVVDPGRNRILLSTGSDDNAQIWASDDGGDTWTMKKDLHQDNPKVTGILCLSHDSQHNRLIAGASDKGQIWVSDDGGDTWTLKRDLSLGSPSQAHIFSLSSITIPQATKPDAGTPSPDAGADAAADAGADAADDAGTPGQDAEGGCSCTVTAASSGPLLGVFVLLLFCCRLGRAARSGRALRPRP